MYHCFLKYCRKKENSIKNTAFKKLKNIPPQVLGSMLFFRIIVCLDTVSVLM